MQKEKEEEKEEKKNNMEKTDTKRMKSIKAKLSFFV